MNNNYLKQNEIMAKEFQDLFYPEGHLVAVNLLTSKQLSEIAKPKYPERKVVFCSILSQARYFGRSRVIRAEDQACYAFPEIFGIKKMPENAWKRYVGWQFKSDEVAKLAFETVRKLPMGTCEAVQVCPLQKCTMMPDAVVLSGNAAQMLAIIAGYLYDKGGTFDMQSNNQCSCAGAIAAAILDKMPKIIIPGNAWRLMAAPSVTELLCGIPGILLEGIAKNMRHLKNNGGSQYPPAWQHIQWEPQPPISDLLKPEGAASWVKK